MSSRKLKPQKVDEVSSGRTRMTVEIFLDRDRLDFFGKVGDLVIRDKNADDCKQAVRKALANFQPHAWERMIEADVNDLDNWHHNTRDGKPHHFKLAGDFNRFERARKFQDKGWLRRPFFEDLDEHAQEAQREQGDLTYAAEWWEPKPFSDADESQQRLIIPYSPEIWDALLAIESTIEKARVHIKSLFDPKSNGAPLLAMKLGPLLGAGKARGAA